MEWYGEEWTEDMERSGQRDVAPPGYLGYMPMLRAVILYGSQFCSR